MLYESWTASLSHLSISFSFDVVKRRQMKRNPLTSVLSVLCPHLLVAGLLRDFPSNSVTSARISFFLYTNIVPIFRNPENKFSKLHWRRIEKKNFSPHVCCKCFAGEMITVVTAMSGYSPHEQLRRATSQLTGTSEKNKS